MSLRLEARNFKTATLIFVCILLFNAGCQRKRSVSRWDVDLLLPLAQAELTLENILPDSLLKQSSDGSLMLANQSLVIDTGFETFLTIKDTFLSQDLSLSDMKLADASISKTISLGQICEKGGVTGATIIANQGSMLAIPSMNSTSPNAQPIDGSTLFNNAQIVSGGIDITLTNNFQIDLTDFIFSLSNQSDNSIIIQDTFKILKANGGKVTHTLSLSGKKVESQLVGTILNISSPGTGTTSVLIDTASTSVVDIVVRDIKVSSISAVFSQKTLVDFNIPFLLSGQINKGAQIKYIEIDQGEMEFSAQSKLPENFNIQISSNNIENNVGYLDIPFVIQKKTGNNYTKSQKSTQLNNYKIFTNNIGEINLRIRASVDSSGNLVTITQNDTLKFKVSIKGLKIGYVKGYFGQIKQTTGVKSQTIHLFKKITYGDFFLKSGKFGIYIENGVGAYFSILIKKLIFYKGTQSIELTGTYTKSRHIIKPANAQPFISGATYIEFNENNSNILDLITFRADRIEYELEFELNPGGNIQNYSDFASRDSKIKIYIQAETPVSVGLGMLTLEDTVSFSPGNIDKNKLIGEGEFKLISENGFPFYAFISLSFLNVSGELVDKIWSTNNLISAGEISPQNPAYCIPKKSILKETFNSSRIGHIKSIKKVVYKVSLVTDKSQIKTLYPGWKIRTKLVADFNYNHGE